MVIFDQYGIEQAGAVIVRSATSHGVLFQSPPPRRCLARVVYSGFGVSHALDILTCQSCNA